MAEIQAKLQALSEEYKKLQEEVQTHILARQKLDAQKTENEGVKKQFDELGEDETIYKLSGPGLLKQDKVEAMSTVDGRLNFIRQEISRLDTQIDTTQNQIEKVKGDIIRLQTQGPSAPPAAAKA